METSLKATVRNITGSAQSRRSRGEGNIPADFVLSKFYNGEKEEVEFLIEDSVDILNTFLKDKELAIKEASERRIIDVI